MGSQNQSSSWFVLQRKIRAWLRIWYLSFHLFLITQKRHRKSWSCSSQFLLPNFFLSLSLKNRSPVKVLKYPLAQQSSSWILFRIFRVLKKSQQTFSNLRFFRLCHTATLAIDFCHRLSTLWFQLIVLRTHKCFRKFSPPPKHSFFILRFDFFHWATSFY